MDINEIRASTERAFDRWLAAATKLDYFLMTVAGALVAYIAKDYHPHRLNSWLDYFDPVSILLLLASFTAGAYRVHWATHVLLLDVERLKSLVELEKYRPGLTSPGPGEHSVTGRLVEKAEAQAIMTAHRAMIEKIDRANSTVLRRTYRLYQVCLWLLLIGMIVLVAGRLLAPYFPTSTMAANSQKSSIAMTGSTKGVPGKSQDPAGAPQGAHPPKAAAAKPASPATH